MRTNFEMIRELNDFTPAHRGILNGDEVQHITKTLHLEEIDELELRNMRDFAVMFYGRKMDRFESKDATKEIIKLMDIMSAVTGVIDSQLWKIGAEV